MKNFAFTINGNDYEVKVLDKQSDAMTLSVNGETYTVGLKNQQPTPAKVAPATPQGTKPAPAPKAPAAPSAPTPTAGKAGGSPVLSPLPGVIVKLLVAEGDTVAKGDRVAVLEAMKMENDIKAHQSGTIASVSVAEGDSIPEGTTILTIA